MLARILSVQDSTEGIADAVEELIGVVFQQNPRCAVFLLKETLELKLISHQSSVSRILKEALNTNNPPITEVFYTIINLLIPLVPGKEPNLVQLFIEKVAEQDGSDSAIVFGHELVERIRAQALSEARPGWLKGIAKGIQNVGYDLEAVGLKTAEIQEPSTPDSSHGLDRRLYLQNGQHLEQEEVIQKVNSIEKFHSLLAEEDQKRSKYFDWTVVFENLTQKLSSSEKLEELEQLMNFILQERSIDQFKQVNLLTTLSQCYFNLSSGISLSPPAKKSWELAERALEAMDPYPYGWYSSYGEGSIKRNMLKMLVEIDAERGRELAIERYVKDICHDFPHIGSGANHLDEILLILQGDVPVKEMWQVIALYLDELFAGIPLEESQPLVEALKNNFEEISENNTTSNAINLLLSLHLDHPSYVVAQGGVRACTSILLAKAEETNFPVEHNALVVTLTEALERHEKATERGLMVLDAVSLRNPEAIVPFMEVLNQLRYSLNFLIRLIATQVYTRATGEEPRLLRMDRDLPFIYTLELPLISSYQTERLREENIGALIGDPAFQIKPLDTEIRNIARLARLSEDNVLYAAVSYFNQFKTNRTWLSRQDELDPDQLTKLLERIGLSLSHYKPHIAPARQALFYVTAELYDNGYLNLRDLSPLPPTFVNYDPLSVLQCPKPRPQFIAPLKEVSIFDAERQNWLDSVKDSLSLLCASTSDGQIILGEWTRLRLGGKFPQEERMSLVRAKSPNKFWGEFNPEDGHPPFANSPFLAKSDYLSFNFPSTDLVIACHGYRYETSGNYWLALNPAIARLVGWHPVNEGLFRWKNQWSQITAESIWWEDGSMERWMRLDHPEIGSGWLVVITQAGFEELTQQFNQLNRGGMIRRSLGWNEIDNRSFALKVTPLN